MPRQAPRLRVLYLQHAPSVNGRDALLGHHLLETFKGTAEECLLAHCVVDELPHPLHPDLGTDLISVETVRRFRPNVIYLERGLFAPDGKWRIERQFLDELTRNGCVLIAADVDTNRLNHQANLYLDGLTLFKTTVSRDHNGEAAALLDDVSNAGGWFEVVCHPAQMTISDWVKPIYQGIERIVVGAPAPVSTIFADPLASGDRDSVKVLVERGGAPDTGIFAIVYKLGDGYAVSIAGGVTADVWAGVAPDNTIWLVNIASFLTREVQRNRARRHHLTSGHTVFLSHRSIDRTLVARVSAALRTAALGTWLDQNEVVAGDAFVREIERGLATMTAFALFWSASCVDAEWVAFELEKAVAMLVSRDVPILVVRLDETRVPDSVQHLHRIEAAGMTGDEIATMISHALERRAERSS